MTTCASCSTAKIYGYAELRKELEEEGAHFRTSSDTEVFLNAYRQWGEGAFERVDGMFAAGLYDRRREQLTLVRDRFGIKPLYYFWDGRHFAFASELAALEALVPADRLHADASAFYDALTYRCVPAPKTPYLEVQKLLPASFLRFDLKAREVLAPRRYWQLEVDSDPAPRRLEEAAEELRGHLDRAVAQQLVADVPVGALLSGGLDSSTVVACASAQRGGESLRTYSLGFDDPTHDERDEARRVAARFGTQHREQVYSAEDIAAHFGDLRSWYGEPFADASAFPTYRVCQLAREDVVVALSGDGGDEVFGGYRWYRRYPDLWKRGAGRLGLEAWGRFADRQRSRFTPGSAPARLLAAAALYASDPFDLRAKLVSGLARGQKSHWAERLEIPGDYDDAWALRKHWREDLPLRTRLQLLDLNTFLPDDILTKVDRASMRHGLEVRVPLLDRALVEFSFSLPESLRFHAGALKGLLRYSMRDALPASTLASGKRGFSPPLSYRAGGSRKRRARGDWGTVQERVLREHWNLSVDQGPQLPAALGAAPSLSVEEER